MAYSKIVFTVTKIEDGTDSFLGRYMIKPDFAGIIDFYTSVMKKKLPTNLHLDGNKDDGFIIGDGDDARVFYKFKPFELNAE